MKKFLLLLISIFVMYIVYGHFSEKDSSQTTSGIVLSKEVNPYRIILEVSERTEIDREVEIEVKDRNLWNLIEPERAYFVTYSSREPKIAVLDYIELCDDLKESKATDNASYGGLQSYINYKLLEQALKSNQAS